MTLELEKGKSEKLRIYADSDPIVLATEFCNENNLDENAINYLTEEIEKLIISNKNRGENLQENEENYENEENESGPGIGHILMVFMLVT